MAENFMGLGVNIPTPDINVTGFLSSSWIWILIIAIVGILLIVAVALILFYKTYSKKVIIFENISGQGYQPIIKTRARLIKLGIGGEELLKTLAGGHFLSAYGRKMGKNTYWYAKGPDGYLYNFLLGDLDAKMAILDVEPVDRDVRMFHVAIDRLSQQTYGKTGFLEKYGVHIILFFFLLALIGGMWLIIGKVGSSTEALAATAETNQKVLEALERIMQNNEFFNRGGATGLVPATS